MKQLIALSVLGVALPAIALGLNAYGAEFAEPGSLALVGIGLIGLGLARQRVRNDP